LPGLTGNPSLKELLLMDARIKSGHDERDIHGIAGTARPL
jgi:hypothetical protein